MSARYLLFTWVAGKQKGGWFDFDAAFDSRTEVDEYIDKKLDKTVFDWVTVNVETQNIVDNG